MLSVILFLFVGVVFGILSTVDENSRFSDIMYVCMWINWTAAFLVLLFVVV